MSDTIDNIKKSNRGRPKADTEPVMVRLPADLLSAIEEYRRRQDSIPTRPEAIRLILAKWLNANGYRITADE